MALYKNPAYLVQSDDRAFDVEYKPGDSTPYSGIYRCTGCEWEVASNERQPMPTQSHHVHPGLSPIRWKLVVFAQHKAK